MLWVKLSVSLMLYGKLAETLDKRAASCDIDPTIPCECTNPFIGTDSFFLGDPTRNCQKASACYVKNLSGCSDVRQSRGGGRCQSKEACNPATQPPPTVTTEVTPPVDGGITKPVGPLAFVCPGSTACDCISPSPSCDMCHVDCTADCNDLTMDSSSKCFSELACDPGLLLELDTGLNCPGSPSSTPVSTTVVPVVGSLSLIRPGDGICNCISAFLHFCEVECTADCNDLTQDSITSKCFSEFACDKTLLLEVDNTQCPVKTMPPPVIGGARICECLNTSESEDCKTCEVDCEADCNDIVGVNGKCFSDLACEKGLLFDGLVN